MLRLGVIFVISSFSLLIIFLFSDTIDIIYVPFLSTAIGLIITYAVQLFRDANSKLSAEIEPQNKLDAKAWFSKGVALGNLGRHEEAVEVFDKAVKLKPDYNDAWFNKGAALENLGRHQEAVDAFDRSIEIKDDYADTWFSKGVALGNLGRHEEAVKVFDKAIQIKDDYVEAWYGKGVVLGELGKNDEALKTLDEGMNIFPKSEQLKQLKDLLLSRMEQGKSQSG